MVMPQRILRHLLLILTILGRYHARDIHSWHDGKCDFHSEVSCTCGNCEDDQVNCDGQEYHTKSPLTCPFRALAFEIEFESRASQATHIIHPELGRGHSSYPKASQFDFGRKIKTCIGYITL